ncbi:MAG: hypothetical protein ACRC5H_00355 [Treponemataceae bacterium]
MKKTIFLFLIFGFLLTGCLSTTAKAGKLPVVYGKDDIPRPDWVVRGKKSSDFHYEVGDGKLATFSNSKVRAESSARERIALWIKADVAVVLKNYAQDAGLGDVREVIDFMDRVSTQSAEVSLRGVAFDDVWEDKDGTVYVLAGIPMESVITALDGLVKQESRAFVRKEEAAFAEFKAKEAFAALEESKK